MKNTERANGKHNGSRNRYASGTKAMNDRKCFKRDLRVRLRSPNLRIRNTQKFLKDQELLLLGKRCKWSNLIWGQILHTLPPQLQEKIRRKKSKGAQISILTAEHI